MEKTNSEKCAQINLPQVVGEVIDGEAVIINLESGIYYSLDGVGGDIWACVERGLPLPGIVDEIGGKYDADQATVDKAVNTLVDELVSEGLVTLYSGDGTEQTPVEAAKPDAPLASFKAPVLIKYKDMQDLLLLDPIHEVDELGWPNVKPDDG
jgi:hypothetical protein